MAENDDMGKMSANRILKNVIVVGFVFLFTLVAYGGLEGLQVCMEQVTLL